MWAFVVATSRMDAIIKFPAYGTTLLAQVF
jgi:hypothetical protein